MPINQTNSRISKTTAFITILAIILFVVVTTKALKRSAERHHLKANSSQNHPHTQANQQ